MNFRKNYKDEHKNHGHNPMKHMLHMILCCGLPIIIIWVLPFVARTNPAFAVFLGVITPFICPIIMIGMMIMMSKKNGNCCEEAKVKTNSMESTIKEKE